MIQFKKTEQAKRLERLDQEIGNLDLPDLNFTPKRATQGSNGYDLFACITKAITIYPDEVVKIGTGVHIWIGSEPVTEGDANTINPDMLLTGLLMPRSSSKGLILNNTIGLIDSDYQGEVMVKYRNITPTSITINPGECFAQLVITFTYAGAMLEVNEFIETTQRGEGGFGSTDNV